MNILFEGVCFKLACIVTGLGLNRDAKLNKNIPATRRTTPATSVFYRFDKSVAGIFTSVALTTNFQKLFKLFPEADNCSADRKRNDTHPAVDNGKKNRFEGK